MTNPFDLAYLAAASPTLGPFAWAFLALQVVLIAAGLYLKYRQRPAVALPPWIDLALLGLGGTGVVLGGLRLGDVPVLNQRYWFYILLMVELGVAGYVFLYTRRSRAAHAVRSQASRGKSSSRRPGPRPLPARSDPTAENGASGTDAAHAQPVHSSSRRESRRGRKRKHR